MPLQGNPTIASIFAAKVRLVRSPRESYELGSAEADKPCRTDPWRFRAGSAGGNRRRTYLPEPSVEPHRFASSPRKSFAGSQDIAGRFGVSNLPLGHGRMVSGQWLEVEARSNDEWMNDLEPVARAIAVLRAGDVVHRPATRSAGIRPGCGSIGHAFTWRI